MDLRHDLARLAGTLLKRVRAGDKKLAAAADVASGGNLSVSSEAVSPGGPIPARFAREPAPAPPLAWGGIPEGTREIALICEDPDAPFPKPFVHWVVYGLPPTQSSIDEGAAPAHQGKNSTGTTGFAGPKPPPGHGVHHYHFQVFALNAPTGLPSGVDRDTLVKAMNGHVLDWGELVGTYEAN